MKTSIRLAFLIVAVAFAGAGCVPHVRIAGRLAFGEDDGCASSYNGQVVSWTECHAFKRHFNRTTGAPVTQNARVADTLRPLSVSLDITYSQVNVDGTTRQCARGVYRADRDGYFNAYMPACGGGRTRIVARPFLQQAAWQIEDGAPIDLGFIRGVWRESEALEVFPDLANTGTAPGQSYAYEAQEPDAKGKVRAVRYAIPSLGFRFEVAAEPDTKSQVGVIPVGTHVFLTNPKDDRFGYLRQVLSAFQTMVELHARLKRQLRPPLPRPDGKDRTYDRMFRPMPEFKDGETYSTYLVAFNDGWAHGGANFISVYRPDLAQFQQPNGMAGVIRLLSSTGTLAHEFGHSIHGALASGTMRMDGEFGVRMLRPDGSEARWGHFPGQFQENGFAFTEGVASSLGQFFLNGCNGSLIRPQGGVTVFAANPWSGNNACDGATGLQMCPFHYVRAELNRRGVTDETGQTWKDRTAALRALTATAVAAAHGNFVYNDEWRWAEFGCDILDTNSDVAHAAVTNDARYVRNFTQAVGEVLDGRDANAQTARFPAAAAAPEDVEVPLPQFIAAMAAFCPSCESLPAGPGGADYNRTRLSATDGVQSPQAFGRYLESQNLITRAQLQNLLRTNLMDELP